MLQSARETIEARPLLWRTCTIWATGMLRDSSAQCRSSLKAERRPLVKTARGMCSSREYGGPASSPSAAQPPAHAPMPDGTAATALAKAATSLECHPQKPMGWTLLSKMPVGSRIPAESMAGQSDSNLLQHTLWSALVGSIRTPECLSSPVS